MKRPKLRQSLAKHTVKAAKKRRIIGDERDRNETGKTKKDRRVVWHHWSDEVRTQIPYRPCSGTAILVVGDGDLSFSRALCGEIPGEQIISTSYEDEFSLARKYPDFTENLAALKKERASVLFKVDATKLSLETLSAKLPIARSKLPLISAIVFNFPHTGEGIKDREHNILKQQKLVLGFLKCSSEMLHSQCSEAYEKCRFVRRKTIMAAPLGHEKGLGDDLIGLHYPFLPMPEIHLTLWIGDPYDDWNIKKLGASIDILDFMGSAVFDAKMYEGYKHCRTSGNANANAIDDEKFVKRSARTFMFQCRSYKD